MSTINRARDAAETGWCYGVGWQLVIRLFVYSEISRRLWSPWKSCLLAIFAFSIKWFCKALSLKRILEMLIRLYHIKVHCYPVMLSPVFPLVLLLFGSILQYFPFFFLFSCYWLSLPIFLLLLLFPPLSLIGLILLFVSPSHPPSSPVICPLLLFPLFSGYFCSLIPLTPFFLSLFSFFFRF